MIFVVEIFRNSESCDQWLCVFFSPVVSSKCYNSSFHKMVARASLATVQSRSRQWLQAAGISQSEAAVSARFILSAARARKQRDEKSKIEHRRRPGWRALSCSMLNRRAQREPLQYVLGEWRFYPLPVALKVRKPVLIPRPETEQLVDIIINQYAAKKQAPMRVLDIGCGSGAICVSLLHAFPNLHGTKFVFTMQKTSLGCFDKYS